LLAFAAGVALCRKGVPEVVQFGLGGIFFALAINTVDAAPAAAIRQLECPTLRMLGRWSYSLYLWQQPFFILACLADPVWRLPLLAAAISTGMAAFMLVESPSRRGLNQLWTRIERRCRPSAVLATGAGRRIRSEAA
jgi:peptidoglycan/LPS O-acetylase OafA/YrhL